MIALLMRAGCVASQRTLFDALVEVAANGLRVLDAINAGITPVLQDADGRESSVEISS